MTNTSTTISVEALAPQRCQVRLVDVRSLSEHAAGHIPGAECIPMDQIESRLGDFEPNVPLVLICQSGRRAEVVRSLLADRHPNVSVLTGGTTAWQTAGHPVVSSTKSRWSLERQVRLGAGVLVLAGLILGLTVSPSWLGLTGFVGVGLTFAGLTDICGMALILAKMPWNQAKSTQATCPN